MFHCNRWARGYAYAHTPSRNHSSNRYESRSAGRGGFGVRRPVRYLSYHLDLDESQRRKVAASFERVKLEREQARLDRKKIDTSLADVFQREDVSVGDLQQALQPRDEVNANLQAVLAKELFEISSVLDEEQREEFAHLLRTGVLQV